MLKGFYLIRISRIYFPKFKDETTTTYIMGKAVVQLGRGFRHSFTEWVAGVCFVQFLSQFFCD